MNERLSNKLKTLPDTPGVYFHRSKSGEIIYVGKAAVLKNRVRQYFQSSKTRDAKTQSLVAEIASVDWMIVDSEIEALFLEAEMIRRYKPKFNILLRDDKSMAYIRIDYQSEYPTVTTTRRPLDDKAKYFGPFLSASSLKKALRILRRIFPYATKKPTQNQRASLYYHLGLDPGLEEGRTSLKDYRANLKKLMAVISGKKLQIEKELQKDMDSASKAQNFELAAKYRNQLSALKSLKNRTVFSDKEFASISGDHALNELTDLLSLKTVPRRIEAYDISHMAGTDVVASMVVFINGLPDKSAYRKFKMRINQNNDFFNMNETLSRRLKDSNVRSWGIPDLVVIDGGKGQLDAALKARDEHIKNAVPFISLAKRQEQIVTHKTKSMVSIDDKTLKRLNGFKSESLDYITIDLPLTSNAVKLLQRIRDESHRFAVSYHSVLKTKRQTTSLLDSIPGIGPSTRKKLQRKFASVSDIKTADEHELSTIVGSAKAKVLKAYLRDNRHF